MKNTEQTNNKSQIGIKVDSGLLGVLERFRTEEDRSMSNMVCVLLKTHPRVQPVLDKAETARVTA